VCPSAPKGLPKNIFLFATRNNNYYSIVKKNNIQKEAAIDQFDPIFFYIEKVMLSHVEMEEQVDCRITENMVNAMFKIGEYFAGKYRSNDSVTVEKYSHNLQQVVLKFEKLKMEIAFGFDRQGFYVSNILSFQTHLKSTNDTFWSQLFSLSDYGKVKYDQDFPDCRGIGKEIKSILRQNTSSILHIAGGFLLNLADHNSQGGFLDNIEVEIHKTKSREDLFTNIEACIDAFHALNYQLYHIDYLSARRFADKRVKQ
jgi:hypothetical protein